MTQATESGAAPGTPATASHQPASQLPASPGRRADDADPALREELPPPVPVNTAGWRDKQSLILVISDTVVLVTAMVVAFLARFGEVSTDIDNVGYVGVGALIVGIWLLFLANAGCYETRFLGAGTEEFRRLGSATVKAFAVVAVVAYGFHIWIARGFVAIAMPLGFALLLLARYALRKELQHARRAGRALHRVVVVGDRQRVAELNAQLRRDPNAGFAVIGACLPEAGQKMRDADEVPVVGTFDDVAGALARVGADTVAVMAGPSVTPQLVREIAWGIEGMAVDLVVAPAITDVAGPRITMRPVAGLPLIYVEEPEFTGIRRVAKRGLDLVGSGLGIVVLSPVMAVVAVLVRTTSPGPALFRQPRVGRDGRVFDVVKFRTMGVDAQALQDEVWSSDVDGLANKVKADPRVTRVGRHLRRWSVDELPQLFNVFVGHMSLVGPRPLQPVEVDGMPGSHNRRHLSQPGITGLWQVSGRSDTTWDERMRLDLYYVENWSLGLDIAILVRTMLAVVRGSGAY